MVTPEEQAKKLIRQTSPVYPEQARKAGFTGLVQVNVVIGEDGRVAATRSVHAMGLGLEEAAIAAVAKWVYEPTFRDGKAIAVATTVNVRFGN